VAGVQKPTLRWNPEAFSLYPIAGLLRYKRISSSGRAGNLILPDPLESLQAPRFPWNSRVSEALGPVLTDLDIVSKLRRFL
jgi:hypothetical protein